MQRHEMARAHESMRGLSDQHGLDRMQQLAREEGIPKQVHR